MTMAKVAIFGRPNVGKSTLMNRILARREAIVENVSGVTRDRKEADAEWQGREFTLIDTGGWMQGGSELDDKVTVQAEAALAEADVAILVVDARIGVTSEDMQAAAVINRKAKSAMLAANKVDTDALETAVWDFMRLGVGEPFAISSLHGKGVADMLDEVVNRLPAETTPEPSSEEERVFAVAFVGRPNVGKSSLFNLMIGEERSIIHDFAGTTRDTVDTTIDTEIGPIKFLDTAGMRRKSKIDDDTEFYSVLRTLKSVDKADIALLVLDATEGVTQQDQRLAERVDAAGCPIVIVINKIDLIDTQARLDLDDSIKRRLSFLPSPTVHRVSALTSKGVNKIMPSLSDAIEAYSKRVPTKDVNAIVRRAQQAQPAPEGARILYATQGATDPPTFTLFANRKLHETYLRYIERELRSAYEFGSAPIKMRVRLRNE